MTHSQAKKNFTETILKESWILKLLVKDIKSTVLDMLNEPRETKDKKLKEIRRVVYEQIGDLSKEIEIMKRTQ